MIKWAWVVGCLFTLSFSCFAPAQTGVPGSPDRPLSMRTFDPAQLNVWMDAHETRQRHDQVASAGQCVSMLDLQAPGAARKEYEKGLQLLMRKRFSEAELHLSKSTSIYPKFVAAHSALGSAYLDAGQNELARTEFAQAVMLDDHLPNSHWNLGRAELALNHFSAAEEAIQKASSIAPLDLHLLTALSYVQYLNHDYEKAIATSQTVHERKHEGASIVHYFAAASWQKRNNLQESQRELQLLLNEDANSPAAEQARRFIEQFSAQANQLAPVSKPIFYAAERDAEANAGGLPTQFRGVMQKLQQENQIAEVDSAPCAACAADAPARPPDAGAAPSLPVPPRTDSDWTLRSTVDEAAVLFAATDHGKAVSGLTRADVAIRDDGKPPASILEFRNESELPLRLGLVIDTSASITTRFSFEQRAAARFLEKVLAEKNDLAFVVGFSNSVLLIQDFTRDERLISHGIAQLAPAGGTAAWDAVSLAVDKLGSRREERPVARIVVVISDGEDNSSSATLKEVIAGAQRHEVMVYTVSTNGGDAKHEENAGNRALKILSERTGGAAFVPNSLSQLNHNLEELQQVIRSRYLISYKPSEFARDDRYRTIDIRAEKAGRKLRVYARKGYYARRAEKLN